MMKFLIALYVFLFGDVNKELVTTFHIADCGDMLATLVPLRSKAKPLYIKSLRPDFGEAHKQRVIEQRREEFHLWKENNTLLFAS